jgi:hypothetical protein
MSNYGNAILTNLKSEKGFSPVIIMAILLFLSVAIIGGSYYVKNFTNILKSQAAEEVTEVPVNQPNLKSLKDEVASKSASPTPPPVITNQEYVIMYGNSALTGNSSIQRFNIATEKTETYLDSLVKDGNVITYAVPSSSGSKILVVTLEPKQGETTPSEMNYYICSDLLCNNTKKIDKSLVSSQLTFQKNWTLNQWVYNSNTKIIITAFSQSPETSFQRIEIAVLDIETMEVKSLLRDYMSVSSNHFLDLATDTLVISNKKSNDEDIVSTYNLLDNKRNDYPAGIMENHHIQDMGKRYGFGPFYVQSKKGEEADSLKNLEVYSLKGDLVSSIPLPNISGNWAFNKHIVWSHTNNHFAVLLVPTDSQSQTPPKIYFYTKEGTVAGFTDIPLQKLESGDWNINTVTGGIFSKDDKRFILATNESSSIIAVKWRFIPVENNAKVTKEIMSKDLGAPLLWY